MAKEDIKLGSSLKVKRSVGGDAMPGRLEAIDENENQLVNKINE